MACSPAQLASNRRNSLLSTGPKTPEGKARSRANGLKHGLTGAGVVLASGDAAEVARTFEALEIEMAPNNELARKLVNRVALMTVKLDRCSEHEAKAISYRTRRAVAEFDDARLAEVETAYSWIAKEPATNARRLRGSPEGIDRLVEGLESLRSELTRPDDARWSWQCCEHLHHLMGRRRLDVPVTRARALGDAVGGNFQHLEKDDGADLAKLDRQGWAAGHLIALIDAEVSRLEALYTSTPTTQQTTDLTAAYNALAAAVTSSNITSANIKTIDTDFAAVLAAESGTSTATFNDFSLVAGNQGFNGGGGHGFGGGGGSC